MLKIISEGHEPQSVSFHSDKNSGTLNGQEFSLDLLSLGDGHSSLLLNGKSYDVELVKMDRVKHELSLKINGKLIHFEVKDRFDELLERLGMDRAAGAAEKEVKAPMPGLVLDILVKEGQSVEKDTPLLILEAMKMENVIKSPAEATIGRIRVQTGKAVEKNEVLIEFLH